MCRFGAVAAEGEGFDLGEEDGAAGAAARFCEREGGEDREEEREEDVCVHFSWGVSFGWVEIVEIANCIS